MVIVMRILLVEDEYNLADVIKDRLTDEKYVVDVSYDGQEGLYNALLDIYDLIILDVMLPSINGFEILKKLRDFKINSKIIMLTARSQIEDKLEGLTNGADDYITKPFHVEELIARINLQLRKDNSSFKDNCIKVGDIILNIDNSKLSCIKNGEDIELICKEFLLLEYFMNNENRIISKDQINDKVWGINNESESNNIEAYISFIRKKLKAIGSEVKIKSVRGLGYKLEVNNEEIKK